MDDPRGPSSHSSASVASPRGIERLKTLLSDAELRHRIEDAARGGDVGALADLVVALVTEGTEAGSERKEPRQEQP